MAYLGPLLRVSAGWNQSAAQASVSSESLSGEGPTAQLKHLSAPLRSVLCGCRTKGLSFSQLSAGIALRPRPHEHRVSLGVRKLHVLCACVCLCMPRRNCTCV